MFYKVVHRDLRNSTSYRSTQTDLILRGRGGDTPMIWYSFDFSHRDGSIGINFDAIGVKGKVLWNYGQNKTD
jgi:hypothetical protein